MILDTCALLWLAGGSRELSRAALRAINDSPAAYVSAISGFEIAIRVAKGKLSRPLPAAEWFAKVIAHHGLTVLPLPNSRPFTKTPATASSSRPPSGTTCRWSRPTDGFEKYGLTVLA